MKHILLSILCALLFTMQAKADESGDGWSLSDDGTLTISADFSGSWSGDYPWNSYRKSIKMVIINEGVTSIGDAAFSGCSSLTSINIPSSVTSISASAFFECSSLTSINIPEGVTSIGANAFYHCYRLTSINIPEGVTSIGANTFYNCSSLSSINIPEGVTSIGDEAFSGCSSLTSINIPEGVTSIGNDAFYNCSGLSSINIPEGVTSIGDEAFRYCRSLTSINIPKSVTSIGDEAFLGCSSLSSINISEGVTSIGDEAFYGCSSLSSINIPESVTSIESGAFSSCLSLTSINISESVTSISEHAFSGCRSLTSINIPESVTYIGLMAFSFCSSLTSVYSYATTPAKFISGAFSDTNEDLIIYIPKGTTEAYKAAWGKELNFVEMPASFEYDSNYGDIKLIKWTSSEADVMTIRIAPADGYELQSITIDGVDLLQAAEDATTKAVMNDDGTYTISGLAGDNLAVVVNFSVTTPVCVISSNQEAKIAAIYSLTGAYVGKSLENLQNGLYVVVYSNGETDKVLVK